MGHGKVTDHEGIAELELHHPSHHTFHHAPLTDAAEQQGATRFFRWHIDAALYDLHPPKVTTLLAVEVPQNRQQTVHFDDGTGDELSVSLGTTAFVSGAQAFRALTGEQKAFALFNNRGVWHTVVGSMQPGDRRVYHQCNLASTEPPLAAA